MNDIEKAIERLKSADSHHTQAQYNLDDETIEMAVAALEKQLTDRWVPVSERLPDNRFYENGEPIELNASTGESYCGESFNLEIVEFDDFFKEVENE